MKLDNVGIRDGALLCLGFALVLFFSSYHLFESPETWMDEGLIIQSAQGIMYTGKAALPVAPGIFEPAWYISTGFPVTLPLAGIFTVFGVSLEAARILMLVFLLSLFVALSFFARRAIGGTAALFGFFLLVFFGPLYGNGRNVLGEIPGLLFILMALLPFLRSEEMNRTRALWVGAWAGLAVVTKPIFILFLPALLLVLVMRWKRLELKKVFLFGIAGIFIPLGIWFYIQFGHVTLSQVLAVYTNPHDVNIGSAVVTNIKRLFIEKQPLYFFGALIVWVASYSMRRFRRETIPLAEEVLLFFSVLIFLAYLRTIGYYRYFFPAQVFTLLYLPQSIWYLAERHGKFFFRAATVFLCGLILFQAYETTFRSWVAVHYGATRTEALEHYFSALPAEEKIFVYQAPEVMSFVGQRPVYQYDEVTPSLRLGEIYLPLVSSGKMPRIITPEDFFQTHAEDIFSQYVIAETVDNYVTLIPKKTTK